MKTVTKEEFAQLRDAGYATEAQHLTERRVPVSEKSAVRYRGAIYYPESACEGLFRLTDPGLSLKPGAKPFSAEFGFTKDSAEVRSASAWKKEGLKRRPASRALQKWLAQGSPDFAACGGCAAEVAALPDRCAAGLGRGALGAKDFRKIGRRMP